MNTKKRRQHESSKAPWVLGALVIFALGSGWFFYQQRQAAVQRVAFMAYLGEIKDWVASRQLRIKNEVAEVKAMTAESKAAATQVHYEFYTSLSKMQVAVSAPPVPAKPKLMVSRADDLEKDMLATLRAHSNH